MIGDEPDNLSGDSAVDPGRTAVGVASGGGLQEQLIRLMAAPLIKRLAPLRDGEAFSESLHWIFWWPPAFEAGGGAACPLGLGTTGHAARHWEH